jgi:hypothetical protein
MTMMTAALAMLLQAGAAPPAAPAPAAATPDPALARMVALYDEVCLQAFPIDGGVDRAMAARGATPLTPAQVKVTLVDDPGRGWKLKDGDHNILVFLELPPFHACSVRRFFPAIPPLDDYRRLAVRFERDHPGFAPVAPFDVDRGDIHVHATGEQRLIAGGSAEALFVYDQHVVDPAKRAAGQTAINLRFVHQIHTGG